MPAKEDTRVPCIQLVGITGKRGVDDESEIYEERERELSTYSKEPGQDDLRLFHRPQKAYDTVSLIESDL